MLRERIEIEQRENRADYNPYRVATSYAPPGENDQAFLWLNKAVESHSGVMFVKVDGYWSSLRSDPHFTDILRKMALSQ